MCLCSFPFSGPAVLHLASHSCLSSPNTLTPRYLYDWVSAQMSVPQRGLPWPLFWNLILSFSVFWLNFFLLLWESNTSLPNIILHICLLVIYPTILGSILNESKRLCFDHHFSPRAFHTVGTQDELVKWLDVMRGVDKGRKIFPFVLLRRDAEVTR